MSQSNLKKIFGIVCVSLALIAIVLFLVALIAIDGYTAPFVKTMMIIVSVLCLAAAVEFGFMYYVECDTSPNYFLYNPNTKRNIPAQKITFQIINSRLNRYLSGYAPSDGKLWTDKILDDPHLEMEDKFRPAVAYKLLFDLAESDKEQGWTCFELASVETVDFICDALDMNGDGDVSRTLRQMKATNPMNIKYVRDYLVKNKAYLKNKLVNYIYDNIRQF